jgi:hypothetical protein
MLRTVDLKVQVKTVFRDCAGFSQAFSALNRKSTAEICCNRTRGPARFTRESSYKWLSKPVGITTGEAVAWDEAVVLELRAALE